MPGRHRNGRSRRRLTSLAMVAGLVSAISPLYMAGTAEAVPAVPDGHLVIHKYSGNDNTTVFPFTLDPGNVAVPVTGNSDSATLDLAPGTSYSFSEAVPAGWVFESAACALQSFVSTGTETATGMSDVEIESGKTTSCWVDDLQQSADLSLTKTASPRTFSGAGQTITYTVTATNVGATTIDSVTITDPLLGGNLTDCRDSGGAAVTPPVDLDPGDRLRCTGAYQITSNDVSVGQVVNTAKVKGFEDEESAVVRTASATVNLFVPPPPPPGSPTLGVTKSSVPASGSVVHRGDQVAYTLSYGNTGTAAAGSVAVTDALPADLDYVTGTASNSATYDAGTRTLTWQLGTVGTGISGSVTFTGQVADTATDGEVLRNVGAISAPGINSPSNNDDLTVSVPPPPTGDVTISKAVDKSVAGFGDTLTYSVTVGATGDKTQTHVVATDSAPAGTSYVDGSASCDPPCSASASNGDVTWDIGSLAGGTSTVVTFQVTVDTPTPAANGAIAAEQVSNTAQVSFDADPTEKSNTVVTDIAAVLGEKATRPPKVTPKPAPQPAVLPFTGPPLPMSLMQLVLMAMLAITSGAMLTRRARVRFVRTPVAVVQWRDQ